MGLGRLNPGCETCGCVPAEPPTLCQLIGSEINPISFRLDWRTWGFGNGILSDGCRSEFGTPARFDANYPSIQYTFPPYHDPSFNCFLGLSLAANKFDETDNGSAFPNGARFPVYQDTNCKYGLTNYYYGVYSSVNSCISSNASVGFSRNEIGGIRVAVSIGISAIVFTSHKFGFNNCYSADSTTGSNWMYSESGNGFTTPRRVVWTENGGPSYRQSSFSRTYLLNVQEYEPWPFCDYSSFGIAQADFEIWNIQSLFSINLDDPTFGDIRSFGIWTPDPMPSYGSAFIQGATATILLGID